VTVLTMIPEPPVDSLLVEADRPVALIVDDDPSTRALIAEILRKAGWTVRQARDGEQALLMAREYVPELILLDIALPRISGLEVLREMKGPSWADQPTTVVVVSFYAGLMQLADLRLAEGVVQKPFAAVDLLREVVMVRSRAVATVV
jgi:DNA-binding response OmpR family regulator